jgi:hypothetical protein
LSIATILIVSKIGRVTEAERSYRALIHRLPSGEISAEKLSRTLLWTKVLMLTGVLTIAVMIVFYARPYAAGRDASARELATLETGGAEDER